MNREITVAILGPFGWGNLGDAAIQDAVLAQLRSRRDDLRIVGVSQVPEDTRKRHGVETYAYDTSSFVRSRRIDYDSRDSACRSQVSSGPLTRHLRRIREGLAWRLVRFSRLIGEIAHIGYVLSVLTKIDVLLVSGGGQLDDFFGGAWQHPYTLFKWVVLSKLARTKVIFLSVGVGNISTDLSKRLLRVALGLADYRSYRDEGSREVVRATLGAYLDGPVVPDMAFALPVCTAHLGASQPSGRLVVAVGPMPFCHPDLWPIRNRLAYESYLEALSLFCDRLLRRGVTLRMFPGQTRNDPPVIDDLIRRLRKLSNNASEVLIDVPPVRSVNELLSCIAEVDIVLASRFHGALLALLLRRPVLALSYERKVNQLMKDLNLEEYCVDIEQANVDALSDVFARLQANSDLIARDLETAVRLQTEAVHAHFDFLVTELLPYAER